jgi:hypothetical protein
MSSYSIALIIATTAFFIIQAGIAIGAQKHKPTSVCTPEELKHFPAGDADCADVFPRAIGVLPDLAEFGGRGLWLCAGGEAWSASVARRRFLSSSFACCRS